MAMTFTHRISSRKMSFFFMIDSLDHWIVFSMSQYRASHLYAFGSS
jgi:hypothetical protein